MEKNKNNYLDDVLEIFEEFSNISEDLYTSEELLSSADNLLKIAKGKISRKKIYEHAPKTYVHSSDTFLKITKNPWSEFKDFHEMILPYNDNNYENTNSYATFEQINQGWV